MCLVTCHIFCNHEYSHTLFTDNIPLDNPIDQTHVSLRPLFFIKKIKKKTVDNLVDVDQPDQGNEKEMLESPRFSEIGFDTCGQD